MIIQKTLSFNGSPIEICGRSGDLYFDHLNLNDGTNDFLLQSIARPPVNSVVFDVGANIGLTTVIFSKQFEAGCIYSFEPNPEAFGILQATIKANALTNVKVEPCAIGAAPGELPFAENHEASSASHLSPDNVSLGGGSRLVPVKTIDGIAAAENLARLDLIKIDVEGFEMSVLAGAKDSLKRFKPLVFLEFNSFTFLAYGNVSPRAAIEQLVAEFSEVYCFRNGKPELIRTKIDILGFLHVNLVRNGCIDDLLCVC